MTLNYVAQGRTLQKHIIGSYSSNNVTSRGFGGTIRRRDIFVLSNLQVPKVNSTLNVVDVNPIVPDEKSVFEEGKNIVEKPILQPPAPSFAPEFPTNQAAGLHSEITEDIVTDLPTQPIVFKAEKLTEKELTRKRVAAASFQAKKIAKTIRRASDHRFNLI